MSDTLFDVDVPASEPAEQLSAGRRLTIRQRALIEAGIHPITKRRLHDDPLRKCGNCAFRSTGNPQNGRSFPKCLYGKTGFGYPRATRGAASDVRAWWPACTEHEPLDGAK